MPGRTNEAQFTLHLVTFTTVLAASPEHAHGRRKTRASTSTPKHLVHVDDAPS